MTTVISTFRSLICLLIVVLAGCGEYTEPDDDGISLSWKVCQFIPGQDIFYDYNCERGIPDVKVCEYNKNNKRCVNTNEDGVFKFSGFPMNQEILLSFTKDNYIPRLVPVQTGQRDLTEKSTNRQHRFPIKNRFPPLTLDKKVMELPDKCTKFDIDFNNMLNNTGQIAAIAMKIAFESSEDIDIAFDSSEDIDAPVSGTKVRIGDTKGTLYDIAPYYTTNKGIPCDQDYISDGYALFTDLDPGDYIVKFEVPEGNYCVVADVAVDRLVWGYRTETPNQTRVHVVPGHRTITIIMCYDTVSSDASNDFQNGATSDLDSGMENRT